MEDRDKVIGKLRKRINPGYTVYDKISVIVPVYGQFNIDRVWMSLASILAQRDVEMEIVLAEQSDYTNIEFSRIDPRIRHIHIPKKDLVDEKYFVPGRIRNFAARASNGEFIYNNDGDMLFQNPAFLRKSLDLIKSGEDVVLYRPPMRRLPIENFEEFRSVFDGSGLELALSFLDRSKPYVATTQSNPIRMSVFRKNESGREKVFLYTETDHKRYREDTSNQGKEPMFSTLDTHAGGILMKRSQFDLVGGYCELYAAWGCYDADLQWKLRELFGLHQFPNFPEFEVLHLDHERGYFSQERWIKNRETQNRRRLQGVLKSIEDDLDESS